MFRVDTTTAAPALPAFGAAGTPGYFVNGNPTTGTAATVPGADWFNDKQEELINVLAAAGIAPAKGVTNQLVAAIRELIQAGAGNYALDTGAPNAYVIALNPMLAAYQNGMMLRFKIGSANGNTGAATVNAGPGAIALVRDDGTALQPGDAPGGAVINAEYDQASNAARITSVVPSQVQTLGMVNAFRNAPMEIPQRGTNGTVTAGSAAYTLDGWAVGCTGANVNWAQAAGLVFAPYSLQLTGQAGVTDALVRQKIESARARRLAGKTVTVQAQINNGSGAPIVPTLTVKHANAQDSWAATTTDINAQALQNCPNGATTLVYYTFNMPAGAVNGAEITFDFGNALNGAGKTVAFGEPDIRVGSVLQLPEVRAFDRELLDAQRFFWKSFDLATAPANGLGTWVGSLCGGDSMSAGNYSPNVSVVLPVTMHHAPTVTLYNSRVGGAAGQWGSVGGDGANARVVSVGMNFIDIDNQNQTLTGGYEYFIAVAASAEFPA